MYRLSLSVLLINLIWACASQPEHTPDSATQPAQDGAGTLASQTYSQTRDGFADAALSPLEDFNLKRDEIPPLLKDIENPYLLPVGMTCEEIGYRIFQLNILLGPDWDTPAPDERLRTEKLADAASEGALDAIASEARSFIPFRGLLRKATGADSHQKRYNQAYKKGAQQRAYLKGIGLAKGCPLPARPDFTALPDDSVTDETPAEPEEAPSFGSE